MATCNNSSKKSNDSLLAAGPSHPYTGVLDNDLEGLKMKPFKRIPHFFLLLTIALAFGTSSLAEPQKTHWQEIADEEGIKVLQRKVPGTSFVSFKGSGVMDASIYDVYSIIFDIKHKTKLLSNCAKYELLKVKGLGNLVIYSRTNAPFVLISDRDSVLETQVTFEPETKRIYARFKKGDDRLMPAQDGAVRTLELTGEWVLEALADGKTRVTYEVNADPGGLLPAWLVNLGSRKLPLRTLLNLREQLNYPDDYERARLIVKHLYDFTPFLPAGHPALDKTTESDAAAQKALDEYKSEAKFP